MVPLETLKNIQFLKDFSDDHLQHLASLAEISEFPAGSVVFREGRPSSSVYLVVRGDITLELNVPTRGAMQFQTVRSGDLLAWTAALGLGSMTATASLRRPVRCWPSTRRRSGRFVLTTCRSGSRSCNASPKCWPRGFRPPVWS